MDYNLFDFIKPDNPPLISELNIQSAAFQKPGKIEPLPIVVPHTVTTNDQHTVR